MFPHRFRRVETSLKQSFICKLLRRLRSVMCGDTGYDLPSNRLECYGCLTRVRSNVRGIQALEIRLLYSQLLPIALYEVPCDPTEHINTMHSVTLSKATYLCVGTVVVDPHDLEPTKGRLLVFKVHVEGGKPSLHLVWSTPVQGCVYAMVSRKDTLALSVNSAVSPR